MSIFTLFSGDKGESGQNGINGTGIADVDDLAVDSPILDALHQNKLSKNAFITFSRTGKGSYTDRYSRLKWTDTPLTTNYVTYSENYTQWDAFGLGRFSVVGAISDPLGGSNASELNLNVDTRSPSILNPVIAQNQSGWAADSYIILSFWIKSISGTVESLDVAVGTSRYEIGSITSDWERRVIKAPNASGGALISINPRGDSGTRVGLFGIQVQDTELTDYIRTSGLAKSANYEVLVMRENQNGFLIEEEKQNLCLHSNDLKNWTVTDGTISAYEGLSPFGLLYENIRVNFVSLPTITLKSDTGTLTAGVDYTVSIYAWIAAGSLNSLTASLGDGVEVAMSQPSVSGFARLSVVVKAGAGDTLTLKATSEGLTAQLYISNVQVETGDISSYIESPTAVKTRSADNVSMDYATNFPAPNLPWTFLFSVVGIPDDADTKTVFSNGLSSTDEFSLTYTNKIMTLTNGANTATYQTFDFTGVALVYDGAELKIYNQQRLASTQAMGSTTTIGANAYLGYNGANNYLDGYLSRCMFYNLALSEPNIQYLMGAK